MLLGDGPSASISLGGVSRRAETHCRCERGDDELLVLATARRRSGGADFLDDVELPDTRRARDLPATTRRTSRRADDAAPRRILVEVDAALATGSVDRSLLRPGAEATKLKDDESVISLVRRARPADLRAGRDRRRTEDQRAVRDARRLREPTATSSNPRAARRAHARRRVAAISAYSSSSSGRLAQDGTGSRASS